MDEIAVRIDRVKNDRVSLTILLSDGGNPIVEWAFKNIGVGESANVSGGMEVRLTDVAIIP